MITNLSFVLKNLKTNAWVNKNYPRNDLNPVVGLDENYKFYVEIKSQPPSYNFKTHKLIIKEEFSDEPYEGHEHIGIFNKGYEILQLTNDEIIQNLNVFLGIFLDSEYPMWERNKHAAQVMRYQFNNEGDSKKINYILQLADWCRSCRELRDEYEFSLIENGQLPSFEWYPRPNK